MVVSVRMLDRGVRAVNRQLRCRNREFTVDVLAIVLARPPIQLSLPLGANQLDAILGVGSLPVACG
jgi:hypothetical protein